MMFTRALAALMLFASLTLIADSRSNAAAPAAEKVYTVDSDQNQPDAILDGSCDTGPTNNNTCTLRAAVQEANSDGSPSRIKFASKMTINYPNLDTLIEPFTVIDASDQWDGNWPGGEPGVTISDNWITTGLLGISGDYAAVRGINFSGGGNKGIVVYGSKGTVIGGTEPGQRNVFTLTNGSTGVLITGGSSKTDVRGNYFGTKDGQNAFLTPGWYGVYLTSGDNTIRDNLIVGQTVAGISLFDGHNLIMDNIIGADVDKQHAIPNEIGIWLEDSDENQIGPGNDILNSTQEGILIKRSDNNLIAGNEIESNGSDGIQIVGSVDNRIGIFKGNSIKYNKGHGILMLQVHNTQVLQNQICANKKDGIHLFESQNNTIGGPLDHQENDITDNGDHGIYLGAAAHNNTVSGNNIGLPVYGCNVGNQKHGLLIENGASDNQIGGLEPGKGNWIGYNRQSGIYISGSGTTGNVVEGNVIGSAPVWLYEAPNSNHGIGIYDGASGNWIGWFNTILASGWSGVAIVNSSNNVVWLNNIGTDGADINWGNSFYGVHVVNSAGNQIYGNGIRNNGTHAGEAGVRIQGAGSTNNFISINSIHNNGGLGIELADGGNSSQPAPTINSGLCDTVSGTACPGCIVEIFSDTADEGKIFEASVTADPSTGAFSWAGSPAGPNLTATASKVALGPTSQFSAPYNIGVCNSPPIAAFTYTPNKVNTCTPVAFDASSSSDVEDPVSALQVRWDWENDGTYDTSLSYQKKAQHIFSTSGVHTVRLEVEDSGGLTDATTRQITVEACGSIFLPVVMR